MKYLLLATATWTESYEHENGKRAVHEPKKKRVEKEFNAVDAVDAESQKDKLLELMKQELELPSENGSFSWHSRFEWRDVALWASVLDSEETKQVA